jgi:transaldolase
MATSKSLKRRIIKERQEREAFPRQISTALPTHLVEKVNRGEGQEVLEHLIFFASPVEFSTRLESLLQEMKTGFNTGDEAVQARAIRFLTDLTFSLRSFLPRWNLQNPDRYGEAVLTNTQIEVEAQKAQALVTELAAGAPVAAEKLLAGWKGDTAARLKAEQASDPEVEGAALVGHSVGEYLANVSKELSDSNLRRISDMRAAGQTLTELSNDYAAFLQHTLYLGASFVTCNPPLVDLAWLAEPERWNPVVDGTIANNPQANGDELARLVTLEVVLANMRLLRPIFLLTEGQMGCVCLQVNPHKHGDAGAMLSDALFIYRKMEERLNGGVPNVVFKLPGTKAGLEACRALTARGIGTTITVNFGMFQHLPFAEAIHGSQAIFGCLVEMSGRLAYPVRDELLAKLGELKTYGIDEARAREAAAWSGIAVLKKLYSLLKARGYDLRQAKPLVASLRIYEGDGYENLPNAFPDITEITGASILSVFPNVRRAFDTQPQIELTPQRIEMPITDDILEVLRHSEIFKQAYYVGDQGWATEDDKRFRPHYELTLADEAGTAGWTPVHNTLTEFCNSYDKFVQRILERKQMLRAT